MWHHAASFGGGDPTGLVGIYLMGVFAGAATACCAPVLAAAVAIAGVSGWWWAGAVLGLFYPFGLVSPLLLSALGIGQPRGRLRDPSLTLRLAGRRAPTTATRVIGGGIFVVLGILMIFLAVSGNASTAPGFQKSFGRRLNSRANELVTSVPSAAG
jgi:cytochrome c biogenesis protein CcdA